MKIAEWFGVTSLVLIILVILLSVVGCGVFLYGVANGDRLTIDNHFVDGDYKGWSEYTIDDIGTIKLPSETAVARDADMLYFTDSKNRIIAIGTWLSVMSKEEFYNEVIPFPVRETSFTAASIGYFGNGAYFRTVKFIGADKTEERYEVTFPTSATSSSTEFVIILDPAYQEINDVFTIAEAIAYSFKRISAPSEFQ